MENAIHNRHKGAPWFGDQSLVIGGAGGIGSWLTLALTRAGFSPIIFDFDTIEEHNLGGQFFKGGDIGKSKVEAVNSNISMFCERTITAINSRITEKSSTLDFTFSAFDNMKARKDLFEAWKKADGENKIFIDGRLEAEQIQIFCVTPERAEEYEKEYLFDDDEVEEVACTFKQTTHVAMIIAGLMTSFFTNHLTNIKENNKIRFVPFYYELFTPLVLSNQID